MAFGTPIAMHLHLHPHHRHHDDSSTEAFPEVPSIEIMESSPVSQSGSRRRYRDTGFPEPLNDVRNTTLPYPGADLSPNARITMEDDHLNADPFTSRRSFRRSRLSKHKRTVSYGRITPQFEALQSVMSIVDATSGMHYNSSGAGTPRTGTGLSTTSTTAPITVPTAAPSAQPSQVPATPISASFSSQRTSREETDSFDSKRDDETPPSSPESHTSRKGGFMSRWRRLSRG